MTSRPRLENTFALLVTCSMDESRAVLAERVVANLVEQSRRLDFLPSLIAFDNGSRFDRHCELFPDEVLLCRAGRNVGYWTAIHWALANHERLLGRSFEFLYIIESDLFHYDIERLADCESFLLEHPDVGAVRTQEFSVRWRWLYDKRLAALPFVRRHSMVVQYDATTGQRVRFVPADKQRRIFTANFHTKLPALNRMAAVRTIFSDLASQEQVTELDFMQRYHRLFPTIAILDGGIYWTAGNDLSGRIITGSWTDSTQQAAVGYENTRITRILREEFDVTVCSGRNRQAGGA
jgi:hypothetical protein